MPRIKPVTREEATPEMAKMLDRIFGKGRDPNADPGTNTGTPGDWWTVWARSPEIMNFFRNYSYNDAPLAAPIRSLALMRTGYVRQSQFVFSQHCKGARTSGVPEEKIAAVPYWQVSNVFTPLERAVLAYVDGLALERGRVHDCVFAELRKGLTDQEILLLTYFINLYILYATTGRSLRLEYDDVPERVAEIPYPETPGAVQEWRPKRRNAQ